MSSGCGAGFLGGHGSTATPEAWSKGPPCMDFPRCRFYAEQGFILLNRVGAVTALVNSSNALVLLFSSHGFGVDTGKTVQHSTQIAHGDGFDQEVPVIGHKAVGIDWNLILLQRFAQNFLADPVVEIIEEYRLLEDSPVTNMEKCPIFYPSKLSPAHNR